VAIFIGTFSYMISAITNDSSITVAPIFWSMIGVGIGVNQIAKKAIDEEKKSSNMVKIVRRNV
jgi:hypothetical protein